MPTINEITNWLALLGISVSIGVIILIFSILIALIFYPRAKLIFSDILKTFGWASKWIRKRSVSLDIEGSINSFTHQFNSEVIEPFLPDCVIQWVSDSNQESVLELDKAIVRVSYKGNDKNLNYYNAAYSFIQTALLHRTKPFLKDIISNAIDLLVTKIILKGSRRPALTIFNDKFRDINDDCKETFFKLEETNSEGLFKRIFLQEYHFLGETLGEKSPSQDIEEETEEFLEWFYALATREYDEQSVLFFERANIKVGVILVASDETYLQYGKEPYLRRANSYASKGFDSIYFLSRGRKKGKILKDIVNELESTECFSVLTSNPDVKVRIRPDEPLQVITCFALRPDVTSIVQRAWTIIEKAYNDNETITVTIENVNKDSISVDAYGLKVEIPCKHLSKMNISDATRYFSEYSELKVKILKSDLENNYIVLSNVDTDTDPKIYVDTLDKQLRGNVFSAKVEKVLDVGGYEFGLIADITNIPLSCFISRSNATYSKYISLSEKYPVGTKINIAPINYNIAHARFECRVEDLSDPWLSIERYQIKSHYTVVVREITERYIVCELDEGLDGRIYVEELTWESLENNLEEIRKYKVGENIRVVIKSINKEKKFIYFSVRQLSINPLEEFYSENEQKIIYATIKSIYSHGAIVLLNDNKNEGYLNISEISWGYCDNIYDCLKKGQQIKVKLINYDSNTNKLNVSIKQTIRNDYIEFKSISNVGDIVIGLVDAVESNRFNVNIKFEDEMIAQAYVHCSELSDIIYIDEKTLCQVFDIGKEYKFIIKKLIDDFQIVELSRKKFFEKNYDKLDYGKEYVGKIITSKKGMKILQSELYEGRILSSHKFRTIPKDKVKAIIARKDDMTKEVEFELIS